MDIKLLDKNVIAKIKGGCNVNNLTQCVTELVLNSLDANSSAIAVRLNLTNFQIQVVDNGYGIFEDDMTKVGSKYMTNKLRESLEITKKPKTHGFHGENLWSISKVSKYLNITSRPSNSEKTFSKTFFNGKSGEVVQVGKRQSEGTTITVRGFFEKIPVRQKKLNRQFELEDIGNFLEAISIIYPQVSFTLRNDLTGELLFKHHKCNNVMQSFISRVQDIEEENLTIIKVKKGDTTIEALLLKEVFIEKKIQYVFFNKRPVSSPKLQNFVNKELIKGSKRTGIFKKGSPMFMLNIKCSLSCYSVRYENSKAIVELKNSDSICKYIQKLISNFFGKTKTPENNMKQNNEIKSVCGISDLSGAIKKYGYKSWQQPHHDMSHFEYTLNIENYNTMVNEVFPENAVPFDYKTALMKPLPIEVKQRIIDKTRFDSAAKKLDFKESEVKNESILFTNGLTKVEKTNEIVLTKFSELEKECEDLVSKNVHQETLFSNLNIDENKGKNLIMYMFLKSTEVQNNDNIQFFSSNDSKETVLESNIIYENINETRKHQFNKTISVSVKIKKTKHCDQSMKNRTNILSNITYTIIRGKKRTLDNIVLEESFLKRKRSDQVSNLFPNYERNEEKYTSNFTEKYNSDKMIQTDVIDNFPRENYARRIEKFENSFGFPELFRFSQNDKIYTCNTPLKFPSLPLYNSFQFSDCVQNKNRGNFNRGFPFRPENCHELFSFTQKKQTLDLKNISFLTKVNINRNPSIKKIKFKSSPYYRHRKTIDLKNISLSPIPKMKTTEKRVIEQREEMDSYYFDNIPSNCFIEYPHKTHGHLENAETNNQKFCHENSLKLHENSLNPRNKFGRFNSEPVVGFANSLLKTKKRIDNLFKRHSSSGDFVDNVERSRTVDRNELFSKDSLEVSTIPDDRFLWKKYLEKKKINDKKDSLVESDRHQRKRGYIADHFKVNNIETELVCQKKVVTEKNEIMTSPDLFSNTEVNFKELSISKFNFDIRSTMKTASDVNIELNRNNLDISNFFSNDGNNSNKANDMGGFDLFMNEKAGREVSFKQPSLSKFHSNIRSTMKTVNYVKNELNSKNLVNSNKANDENNRIKANDMNEFDFVLNGSTDLFSDREVSFREPSISKFHFNIRSTGQTANDVKNELNSSNLVNSNKTNDENNRIKASDMDGFDFVLNGNTDLFSDQEVTDMRSTMKTTNDEKNELSSNNLYNLNISNDGNNRIKVNDMDGFDLVLNGNAGTTTSSLPEENGLFTFKLRPHFIPKGLSPVLTEKERIHEQLNSHTKEKLQHEIFRNQELDNIKWRGNIDDMYRERVRNAYNEIPSVSTTEVNEWSLKKLLPKTSRKFSRSLFDNLKLIGQLDKKFIAFVDANSGFLILFDQHAVHERIRLEKLTKDYENKNVPCENVTLFLTQSDAKLLKNHGKYLNQIGIDSRFIKNGIVIDKIPLSLHRRMKTESRDSNWSLPNVLKILIQEIIYNIKETRGILTGLPKFIQQIVCMEACRGAVKFGDYLTRNELETFMDELSRCTLPFQCAHGRPTMVPIAIMDDIQTEVSRPQLRRLLVELT